MGNCTVKRAKKASKNYVSSVKITVPNLSYLNRREKTLLVVESQESTEISLKKKVKVFRDTCISALPDSSIIVAGGSDSSSSLTNGVYQIFPYQRTIKQLAPLPIPSKFGNFLRYKSFLFYVGGICEAQDFNSSQSEQGTPICKLDLDHNCWKVFSEQNIMNPEKYLKRNIMSEEDKSRLSNYSISNFNTKDLYEPGSIIIADKLYLIGGKILFDEVMQATDQIYSVKLDDDFKLCEENLVFPVKISSPSCCVYKDIACVAGGFLWNMAENLEIFLVDFKNESIRKVNLTIDRPIEPRYPVFVDNKGILCFSPPKMMYLREDKQQIFSFSLPTQVNHGDIEIRTDFQASDTKAVEPSNNLHSEQSVSNLNYSGSLNTDNIKQEKSPSLHASFSSASPQKIESNHVSPPNCSICTLKLKRLRKSSPIFSSTCSYCHEFHSKKYYCSSCSLVFCKSCSCSLSNFKTSPVSYLQCPNFHSLCKTLPDQSAEICLSCNNIQNSPLFSCFICELYLCLSCFSSVEQLLTNLPKCKLDHQMKFVCKSNEVCGKCKSEIKGFGKFYCEACCFNQCAECIEVKSEEEFQVFRGKVKLSYGFEIDESSLCKETEIQHNISINKRELSPFSENQNRVLDENSDIVHEEFNKIGKTQSFATPFEDIKKVILQKPVRGDKSPLVLNLSPKKDSPEDSKFIKRGLANKFTISPKNATISRNSIGLISEQQINKYRSNYYFPKPLNPDFRPSNYAEPSYHRQIEEIKSYLNTSRELKNFEEMKSGQSTLRSGLGVENEETYKIQENLIDSPVVNSKNISHSYMKNPLDSSQDSGLIKLKKVKKSKKAEKEFSENEEIVIEEPSNFNPGSGKIELAGVEKKESENASLFFPTLGDESEQVVAPDIDKHLAQDKLKALKAKLNLLTDKSFDSSVSEQSVSEHFMGFILFNMKNLEESISSLSSSFESSQEYNEFDSRINEKVSKPDKNKTKKRAKNKSSESSKSKKVSKPDKKKTKKAAKNKSSESSKSKKKVKKSKKSKIEDSGELENKPEIFSQDSKNYESIEIKKHKKNKSKQSSSSSSYRFDCPFDLNYSNISSKKSEKKKSKKIRSQISSSSSPSQN